MQDRVGVLLSDANRQVQVADHLLCVTYPVVRDPKLLLSVIEHIRRALQDAMTAVVIKNVQAGAYELPKLAHNDPVAAFPDLVHVRGLRLEACAEGIALATECETILRHHKESPTTFVRNERLVIANEGFTHLREINQHDLLAALTISKRFVHAANQVNP